MYFLLLFLQIFVCFVTLPQILVCFVIVSQHIRLFSYCCPTYLSVLLLFLFRHILSTIYFAYIWLGFFSYQSLGLALPTFGFVNFCFVYVQYTNILFLWCFLKQYSCHEGPFCFLLAFFSSRSFLTPIMAVSHIFTIQSTWLSATIWMTSSKIEPPRRLFEETFDQSD